MDIQVVTFDDDNDDNDTGSDDDDDYNNNFDGDDGFNENDDIYYSLCKALVWKQRRHSCMLAAK